MMLLKAKAAVDSPVPGSTTRLVPPCKVQAAWLAVSVQCKPKVIVSSVLHPLTSEANTIY